MAHQPFSSVQYNDAYKAEFRKVPYLHYPPLWVTLGIVGSCPNRCSFCAYHSPDARTSNSNVYNINYVMPFSVFIKLVDFFYAGHVPRLHLCASGEPLMHDNFLPMLDYIAHVYGHVSFQSSFHKQLCEKKRIVDAVMARQDVISSVVTDVMGNNAIKNGCDEEYVYSVFAKLSETRIQLLRGQFLITKNNLSDLECVIRRVYALKIRMTIAASVVFPYAMNDFTSTNNSYTQDMRHEVDALQHMAKALGVSLYVQEPIGSPKNVCSSFWEKFQIWPTASSDTEKIYENIVPHACNAVVKGAMGSCGYVFDYKNILDLWNNPSFIGIRTALLEGKVPDAHCYTCPYSPTLQQALPQELLS